MKIYLLLSLLLISLCTRASRTIFHRVTTEDGLSSSRVTSVLQDRMGYLWIGTAEGLNRYDGTSFKAFVPVADDPRSIQGSYIERLFEDADGAIWIFFSSGGISRYDPDTDSFLNFTKEWLRQQLRVYGNPSCLSAAVPGHLFIGSENGLLEFDRERKTLIRFGQGNSEVSSSPVNCLYMDPDSTFRVGTLSGYSVYDRSQGIFRDYKIRTSDNEDINKGILNGVSSIYVDRLGYLWLGTGKKGVFRSVDRGNYDLFQPVGSPDLRVYQFLETQTGDFWIGHNKGATLIDRLNRVSLRYTNFFHRPEDLAPTGECHVRSLLEDRNGTVWFLDSRFNQGVYYYTETSHRMERLRNSPDDPYSISSDQISCLYLDRSDRLWIGHPNYGVSQADLNPPPFRYTLRDGGKERLSSNHILAVFEDSDRNLWVGTTAGLDRINARTSRVDKRYAFSPTKASSSLSGQIIGSIAEDSERNLWVSYLDAPPDRLSLESFQVAPLSLDYRRSYEYSVKYMARLCVDPRGWVWFTTRDGGLVKYDVGIGKAYFYTQPSLIAADTPSAFPDLYSLCLDADRWVWIGTDGEGLRSLDAETEIFTDYRHKPGEPNSLSSDHIHCIHADSLGGIWIGTNAGLDRYDKRLGRFEHFSTRDGLAGNIVQGILEGEPGVLFISTNKGISRLDIRNRRIVNYTLANGLLSTEFIAGAYCRRESGELVFGSNAGLVSFDPSRLAADLRKVPESLAITDLRIEGPRGDQSVRIDFVAFDYSHPKSVRFQYQMEGYDTGWKEADAGQRTVLYDPLPPGRYVFKVRTSGNGDCWSSPVSGEIRIAAPWWRTGWSVSIGGVIACALLYFLLKVTLRRSGPKPEEAGIKDDTCIESRPANEVDLPSAGLPVTPGLTDSDKEFISKATRVVLDNIQNPQFDVEMFSSLMAMSRASLFRKLKSAAGCSASSFIRNIRIEQAADLLGQRAYTISEIALMVGFSDPNYFTRCFKEVYGVTPSEYVFTRFSPNEPGSR